MSNKITITEEEAKICKLDGKIFKSSREVINHVKTTYGLTFEEYIIKSYYNGIRPTCLSTGGTLAFKPNKLGPWFADYARNRAPKQKHSDETKQKIKESCAEASMKKFGTANPFQNEEIKQKIKETNIKKYGIDNPAKLNRFKEKALKSYISTIKTQIENGTYKSNKIESSDELDFITKLELTNINHIKQFTIENKKYDIFLPETNLLIEIDGTAFHKDALENLSLMNISTAINDKEKDALAIKENKSLMRIRWNKSYNFNDINELQNLLAQIKYEPNRSISYSQIIITKEYLKNYIELHGKDSLKKYSYLFLKFIRTFISEFPFKSLSEYAEHCDSIQEKFDSFNSDSIYSNGFILNKCPTTLNAYLKSKFTSYWKSKYNKNLSVVDAWTDDEAMQKIIDYRIGLNDSNEIFDFSIKQLMYGLSVNRFTISFFNPFLAFSIYKKFIGDNSSPIVVDPCCGFGGRLLGFKMAYPNGTYIGTEPNKETYDALLILVDELKLTNVQIHNIPYEQLDKTNICPDLTFTSPPYNDIETYSDGVSSHVALVESLKKSKNCILNLSQQIATEFHINEECLVDKIFTSKSPFNRTSNSNSTKWEGLYKIS